MNFVSDFGDSNIFHILQQEILRLSRWPIGELQAGSFFILAKKIDKKLNQQKWRKFILENIFSNVEYVSRWGVWKIDDPIHLEVEKTFVSGKFVDYPPRSEFIALMNHVKGRAGLDGLRDRYVLLCQREIDNRYLFDARSELPLQDFLSGELDRIGIPIKSCDFATLAPAEQAAMCGGASILVAAHGAGLCNMIFTPDDCSVMEFNFRNHWYCDPVCDAHYSGNVAYDVKCDGELTVNPYFHKADYFNLSRLLGRSYVELEVERYQGYQARNPISRKRLFVDGDGLVARIKENFVG